jgi:ankyrin repeat protein
VNNVHTFFGRSRHAPVPRRVAVVLGVLAWSTLASCAEIRWAVEAGDLAQVKALLRDYPGLISTKEEPDGMTPLVYAACMGGSKAKDLVKLLLASGADVNARSDDGHTALQYAVLRCGKDVVELLLANKADVNAKDNRGWTPFLAAVLGYETNVVELLLTNKADVKAKTIHKD